MGADRGGAVLSERGIPTRHAGTRFRSRLEARWACLFDAIGWRWEYEPFDVDGYVPDFAILGDGPLIVEVKPALTLAELDEHVRRVELVERDALIVGAAPIIATREDWSGCEIAGLLIQWIDRVPGKVEAWPAPGIWGRCSGLVDHGTPVKCDAVCVTHDEGYFQHYPCGHYTGGDHGLDLDGLVERAWADARNRTQWRARP